MSKDLFLFGVGGGIQRIDNADDTADNLSRNLSGDFRYIARIEGPEAEVTKLLESVPGVEEVECHGEKERGVFEYTIESDKQTDIRREVWARLADRHYPLLGLKSTEMTLEDIFLKLTSGEAVEVPTKAERAEQEAAIEAAEQEIRMEAPAAVVASMDDSFAEAAEEAEAPEKESENGGEE